MTYRLSWLADVLRSAGLTVVEERDWKTAGHGDMSVVRGVICHHTAGPRNGNAPSLPTVIRGRTGLSGPLANLFLARDGTYHTVAAGRAYHAGAGSWMGIRTGNSSFVGIEAENTGLANDQPWPTLQMAAYEIGVAAVLQKIKAPASMCCGHKEYATPRGRKTDPTFDMGSFRNAVAVILNNDRVYIVRAGDTLYGIARKHGMRLDDLLALNHLTLGSVIYPGDKLIVT